MIDSELFQFPQEISESEKDGLGNEIRLALNKLCSDSKWKVEFFLVYNASVFKKQCVT